jgi:hypothetical protein
MGGVRRVHAHLVEVGEYSGNIQGTFREHSGNVQGTFRERSDIVE